MEFYKILLKIMNERGLSIPDISRKTGLADSTIRSIISRKNKNISLDVAFKLSQGLDVSLEELNGETEGVYLVSSKIDTTKENKKHDTAPLDIKESKLLNNFNKLNDLGRDKAIENIQDLTQIDKYTIDSKKEVKQIIDKPKRVNLAEELAKLDPIETVAAHNDHWDEPGEMEKMLRDIERIKQLKKGEK